MGVAPALGRNFRPEEERFGGPDAALISDAYWCRHFHADPRAIGKTLRIGKYSYSVFLSHEADFWSVSPPDAPYAQDRSSTWYTVIGRLKPRVTLGQGRADLAHVEAQLARQFRKQIRTGLPRCNRSKTRS